jgi:hypothetical protein
VIFFQVELCGNIPVAFSNLLGKDLEDSKTLLMHFSKCFIVISNYSYIQEYKKTPWLLLRKRNITTERPPPVGEF